MSEKCTECDNPQCEGPDSLRKFANWADLASHLSEEVILGCVNKLAEIGDEYLRLKDRENSQKVYHRKHQLKRKLALQMAKRMLDPDELKRLEQIAEQKAVGEDDADSPEDEMERGRR